MTYVQSRVQVKKDLKHSQLTETVRIIRTKVTRRIVQKEDIITVERAKERIRLRTKKEQDI